MSDQKPPSSSERLKHQAVAFFVVGLVVFWLGGLGTCAGLSNSVGRVIYPIVVIGGLALQIIAMVFLGMWAKDGSGRRIGCLMTLMCGSVVVTILFSLLSMEVMFIGFH